MHPEFGTVMPDVMLPILKKAGKLNDLFAHVLNESTSALSSSNLSFFKLSVNLHVGLLESNAFDMIESICLANHFPMDRITLEITEEQAFDPTPRVLANLAHLSMRGVDISIDDFGKGYASLEQLVDLPISEIKIDRRFVSKVMNDYKCQQVVSTSMLLAKNLGLHCVAEGIDDEETWTYLKELGVDSCQGYYTGRPMRIDDFRALINVLTISTETAVSCEPNKTILILDGDQVRGIAMLRLLAKEFPLQKFKLIRKAAELQSLDNDLTVSAAVCNISFVQSLSASSLERLEKFLTKIYTVLVKNYDSEENFLFINSSVTKSSNISETLSKIKDIGFYPDSVAETTKSFKLSNREIDIAKLLLAGFTNKYIAYELGISQKTVSTFKSRILNKAGIKSVVELSRVLKF